MIRRMLESNDNIFYCAECTYDKSNGTMFLYTTDITEVRRSTMPKDSMKVEGGFLVRRKYFRSEYEAQEYIDSLPNAMPMSRNESSCIRRKTSIKEGKTMPYVLWVLDGDTRQWEMYKGVNDAKQFIRDNDYDEFLDELNTQVFPNETYYNNYIDWIVIPAGEEPRKFDTHKFYNSLKYESMRRLGEGNASLKTNYAVIVYDMNTGSYNLYTGTKKMCEQLYKDLFDFNIDDYDDDEKEDMYDWLYGRLNEFNCIERIDFRRGIDYRDNYSDGYDKYHIINYTKPRHPISLYL